MFKIDKNVELPTVKSTYPYKDMEIGDSFEFPISERNKVSSSCSIYGKNNNRKYAVRSISDSRYRCWRIK